MINKRWIWSGLIAINIFILACHSQRKPISIEHIPPQVHRTLDHPQPESGDPEAGLAYLAEGNYLGNGIPYDLFKKFFKEGKDTVFHREGLNGNMPYVFNVFENKGGLTVVSGNCFICHSSTMNGEVVLGLGNTLGDYTKDLSFRFKLVNWMVKRKYKKDSPEWASYESQAKRYVDMAKAIVLDNPVVNPAFRIEEEAVTHRDPMTLTFQEEAHYEVPKASIGSDIPPLWGAKKKKAFYYNGMGQGDFTKHLMQACLLGIPDSAGAREIQQRFDDVWAWLESLEAPDYPYPVDKGLVNEGKQIFDIECSKCHGKYGDNESYPNKIIPLAKIKTDPAYAVYATESPLNEWYKKSWFHLTEPKAFTRPSYGYIAPPLDGVWATAPYLHNGSVPNLETLLNSSARPTYWKREGEMPEYDFEKVGWKYKTKKRRGGKKTYDTTIPGYSNRGHYFGDKLTEEEREAVIEYLKTL